MTRRLCWLLSAVTLGLTACGETTPPEDPDAGNPGTQQEPQGAARIPAYLKASPYSRLVIEVDATEGFAPRATAESAVLDTLRAAVDKPAGVSMAHDQEGRLGP
jgi:hypothetical protein